MARPKSPGLTDHELEVMKVLWEESPLSVADVLSRLKRRPKPAYTSVLTMVQSMEKKGYIDHTTSGKAFVYSPVLQRKKCEEKELVRAADRLYDGDVLKLAIGLVKSEQLSSLELKKLKKILEDL